MRSNHHTAAGKMVFIPNRERIHRFRKKRGWSQEHLATVANLSTKTVQRLEKGRPVSGETLMALAAAFDTTLPRLTLKASAPFSVAFVNEAANTGKTFYTLNQAVMTLHHGKRPAILSVEMPSASARDAATEEFCAKYGLTYVVTPIGELARALQELRADIALIDTPSGMAASASQNEVELFNREISEHSDLLIVPVEMGLREERAAMATAKSFLPHTDRIVFLMYEHFSVPISWFTIFASNARLLGIETLDWCPRFLRDRNYIFESYLPVVDRELCAEFDEASLGAFCGLWGAIMDRMARSRSPMLPRGEPSLVPCQLGGLAGLMKRR